MTLATSNRFACAHASGTDWRDVCRTVLTGLEKIRPRGDESGNDFNLGIIYITDNLADDAESILTLLKSVTNIKHWIGGTGISICANNVDYIDEPAMVVMVGKFNEDDFCVFPTIDTGIDTAQKALTPWLDKADPRIALTHGIPVENVETTAILLQLEQLTGSFITGGLSSARSNPVQISNAVEYHGFSGIVFSQNIEITTMLSQGCAPIGDVHTITKCDDYIIYEIDDLPAFNIFADDMKKFIANKTDEEIKIENMEDLTGQSFKGEVHVAFPVAGAENKRDYLVRNILNVDPDNGTVSVAHNVSSGDRVMFVNRDLQTVQADLSRSLLEIRERTIVEHGEFKPSGAIYISCVARALSDFNDEKNSEISLIHEILGDVPLAGFSAGAEISNARLYGYTSVLILFL